MRYEVICYPHSPWESGRLYVVHDRHEKKDVKFEHSRSREAAWKECDKRNREWEKEKSKEGQA